MSLPPLLEVAVGLILIYLVMSVLCSGINEIIAERVGRRGRFLREGLLNTIGDRWMYLRIVTHPVVWSLYRDQPGKPRPPSYIPGGPFATAAVEAILLKAAHLAGAAPADVAAAPPPTWAQLRAALVTCRTAGYYLADALLPLVDGANGDLDAAKKNIGAWYDTAMDRVSGWYKRQARGFLFLIGLLVAVTFNVDTIRIVTALGHSATLRAAVTKLADQALATGQIAGVPLTVPEGKAGSEGETDPAVRRIQNLTRTLAELEPLGLPVGFSCLTGVSLDSKGGQLGPGLKRCLRASLDEGSIPWILRVIGWLLTAFAVSLGAPFWFDLLNRLVSLRGAGAKPAEKAPARG